MKDESLSGQLRHWRKTAGLSLGAVARRADTSAATLSRYENGWQRFELRTLRKIAKAIGCTLEVRLRPASRPATTMSPSQVIGQLQRLFWDAKLTTRDLEEHFTWIVERVLEYGALPDVKALLALAGKTKFLGAVAESRLAGRTETFWMHMLAKEGMSCTRKFSRREASSCWIG